MPWEQDLYQIWRLQGTFVNNLIDGLYKKTPRHGKITVHSFTVELMSTDQELQDLLREFEHIGLQNIFQPPPAPAACEENLPALTPPMQTRSAKK